MNIWSLFSTQRYLKPLEKEKEIDSFKAKREREKAAQNLRAKRIKFIIVTKEIEN